MIQKTLEFLVSEINKHLEAAGRSVKVELAPVIKENSQSFSLNLRLSLINIDEEIASKLQMKIVPVKDNKNSPVHPDLNLALFVLISVDAAEKSYNESLGYISDIINFFRDKNVFTAENTPDMDASIKKLTVEFYNLDFETQKHVWEMLGAKYLPSAVYRVRALFIHE